MILSAYLLLGSAWMSFLTGCFVVCKVHGPRVTRIRCLPEVAAWVWHQILVVSSSEGLTLCNDSFSCYSSCKEKSSSSTRNLRWPLVSGRKVESLNLETHFDQYYECMIIAGKLCHNRIFLKVILSSPCLWPCFQPPVPSLSEVSKNNEVLLNLGMLELSN
jgi:hypothetical protein